MIDLLKAILFAGIPVAIISYYLARLTTGNKNIKATNAKELKQELKTLGQDNNPEQGQIKQMVYKKYLKFGGGFYGVLAFISYMHIELYQVIDFFKNFTSFADFLDSIGFGMLLNFLLDAIMNLATAFMWPLYWYKYLPIGSFVVWILVVIAAHSMATKYALQSKPKL